MLEKLKKKTSAGRISDEELLDRAWALNERLLGGRGFDFLHPEKSKRRASIEGTKAILKF